MRAENLLLDSSEVGEALRARMTASSPARTGAVSGISGVLQAAAVDSAYRRYTGVVQADEEALPASVTIMALVFDGPELASRTFGVVAEAAHMRTQVNGSDVAVETVSSPQGLVSYWGFVHRDEAIVVIALDTLDPQRLSIADLRTLVGLETLRLDRVLST